MNQDLRPSSDRQAARMRLADILIDFARLAPDAGSTDCLLQLTCRQAARGVDISHSKILRHRPETGDLLMVAGVGWKPGVVKHATFGTDLASPPGRAMLTREPVMQDDAVGDPQFRYSTLLRDHGIRSLLNAPIRLDGAVWGVLEVDSVIPRHFGADDTWFLAALSNILGLILHGRMGRERASKAEVNAALALADGQTLLAELRHRSKNDLQLILAMLSLQKRRQTDAQVRSGYDQIIDQIAAIGTAHDQLAPRRALGRVELADYLQLLCGTLGRQRENIRIEAHVALAEISHERALPLGLVVNELVTNALKYAFPGGRSGTITVDFHVAAQGDGCLLVYDDGVGMGMPRAGSSGTELIRRLVQQIGGQVERADVERGTGFAIRFPLGN